MPSTRMLEHLHFVKGIDPVADAFAATVATDVVNMAHYGRALFVVHVGVGATGTSTFTVEACDDVAPSNTSAIPFWYREVLTGDTEGTLTEAAATGFVNTAGSSKVIAIEVDEEDLNASGYSYVRLKAVESVDSPVLGGVLIILGAPSYAKAQKVTAIV